MDYMIYLERENNKLFKEMDKDPLKTVWHAESECHTWFEANYKKKEPIYEIFVIYGSWIMMHSIVVMDGHRRMQ